MANTKQAKKRAEQSTRRRLRNRSIRTRVRGVLKATRGAAVSEKEKAAEALPATVSMIDTAVRKGVLHRNTAARLKSRVTKAIAKT